MKKANILGSIVMLLMAIFLTFGQGTQPAPDAYAGWDCSKAASSGFCTRTLNRGDTGWDFASEIYGNAALWQRFVEDNPGQTVVKEGSLGPILLWREGVTVRIRNLDLAKLQDGLAPLERTAPVTVQVITQEPVPASSGFGWGSTLLARVFLIALAVTILGAFMLFRRHNANQRARQMRPADAGPPFRPTDARSILGMQPTNRQAINFVEGIQPGTDFLYKVEVRGGAIPTTYADGMVRTALPHGDHLYVGGKVNAQGQITEVVAAWAMCLNRIAQLTPQDAQRVLDSGMTFWNPELIRQRPGTILPSWQAVENFLRNSLAELAATAQPATAAEAVTADAAVADDTAATGDVTVVPTGLTVLPNGAFKYVGEIPIAGGGMIVTSEAGVTISRQGSIMLPSGDEIRFIAAADEDELMQLTTVGSNGTAVAASNN